MRYLHKNIVSALNNSAVAYENQGSRPFIKKTLLDEQHRFCAYSEKYVCEIDETHIEHFDPRIKGTSEDGYYNWYTSLSWMNSHKPKKIEPYLPILKPSSPDLSKRIRYKIEDNLFESIDINDIEARNLIAFLGFNKNELAVVRARHINRIKELISLCNNDINEALMFMEDDKDYFSFATALENVFAIDLTHYIERK